MSVTRYDLQYDSLIEDSFMEAHPLGNYVEYADYADYAKLESERDRLRDEMRRYLPIIERCEMLPALWDHCTQGTGIATANGYRDALQEAEG